MPILLTISTGAGLSSLVCCFAVAVNLMSRSPQTDTDDLRRYVKETPDSFTNTDWSHTSRVQLAVEKKLQNIGGIDEQLLPYLYSANEAISQDQLKVLIEGVAKPLIYQIVQRRLRVAATSEGYGNHRLLVEDVIGDVVLRILQRLRTLKADPDQHPIESFAGLVATTTYTVLADRSRWTHRQRAVLDRKIRRLFSANNNLTIWKDSQNNSVCGYDAWRLNQAALLYASGSYPTESELFLLTQELSAESRKRNTAEIVLFVLTKVGRPVRLNDLVNVTGPLVKAQTITLDETRLAHSVSDLAVQWDPLSILENRLLLGRLFAEIQKLSSEQRKSLLLNMTDSYGYGIEWFLFTKIVTEEQLAGILEVSVAEFKQLLETLPMTDKQIAKQLGISPKRIGNIRDAVRDRLERCRKSFFQERNS